MNCLSETLSEKIEDIAAGEPNDISVHRDANTAKTTLHLTFQPAEWIELKDITTMLDGMTAHTKQDIGSPVSKLLDQLIAQNNTNTYANITCDILNEDPSLKSNIVEKLKALNISSPTYIDQGLYAIVLEQEGLDDMVVRLTSEKREEQHNIKQMLEPLFSEQVAEHMWLEIMPKVKTKGITDDHKNALEQSLQSQHNRHLSQDDIGLFSLTDGTELPICYDTTNLSDVNAPDREQWNWRNPDYVQQYDWETPALDATYDALKAKLDTHISQGEGKHANAVSASRNNAKISASL